MRAAIAIYFSLTTVILISNLTFGRENPGLLGSFVCHLEIYLRLMCILQIFNVLYIRIYIYNYIYILYMCVDTYMCSTVPCGCPSFLACSSCVAHPVADGRSKAATRICIQVEIPTVAWSRCGGWCVGMLKFHYCYILLYKFGWVKRWEIVCVCFGKITACLYIQVKNDVNGLLWAAS